MAHEYRSEGYKILKGAGLEIGALHQPAQLPQECKVEYADVISREDAIKLFPEVNKNLFVDVTHLVNLDKRGFSSFENERFDFVILNHVIEHLANPIKALSELFRVVKEKGYVVIGCPDKEFTFDKKRKLTSFDHLLQEYKENVSEVSDEHYIDFMEAVHPEVIGNIEHFLTALKSFRERREHAHVWNSESFQHFLEQSMKHLNIVAECKFVHTSIDNEYEHFSIWEKKKYIVEEEKSRDKFLNFFKNIFFQR